jgi:predicted small lipoprotein YifL
MYLKKVEQIMKKLCISVITVIMLVTAAGCGVKKPTQQQQAPTMTKKQQPAKKQRRAWWRKRKKAPVKVQPQTAPSQLSERDQKISGLCKQFVDVDNKQVNWSGFCEKMSGYIKDDPELAEVCEVLDKIKDSTSATSACWKLKPHLKKLPQVVYDEFEKFSVSELLSLVSTRMKQEVVEEQPQLQSATQPDTSTSK